MEEERPNEEALSGIPGRNETDLKENTPDIFGPEPEEDGPVYEATPDPEPEIGLLKKDTKEALIIGAVLGLAIGLLMFFVPKTAMEEGARLTISVIIILLGPRLVQDKYHLDFTKGRYTMAAALVLTLIVYILIGHPV